MKISFLFRNQIHWMRAQKTSYHHPNTMLTKPNTTRAGFTVRQCLITILAATLLVAYMTQPSENPKHTKATADQVLAELRTINHAIYLYSVDNHLPAGSKVAWTDIAKYFTSGSRLRSCDGIDELGNYFGISDVDEMPRVSPETRKALSGVVQPDKFWIGYQ